MIREIEQMRTEIDDAAATRQPRIGEPRVVRTIGVVEHEVDSEHVTQELLKLWDRTGGFGTLLMIAHDWDDKEKWVRSMERLAHEVLPALPEL